MTGWSEEGYYGKGEAVTKYMPCQNREIAQLWRALLLDTHSHAHILIAKLNTWKYQPF